MGSGDWFKNIINKKRAKDRKSRKVEESASAKSNGYKEDNQFRKESSKLENGASILKQKVPGVLTENVAAIRVQAAFRAHMARKTFRHLKGTRRLQVLIDGHFGKKQASATLSYLHSWSKIQAQIRARRVHMVTEGHLRQKKMENQIKLEAKLHDLEVEWSGSSETMEELLARIHQREEAAGKRERAMAYAFSHQWRANSNMNLGWGSNELGKTNWVWSWVDHWIAARPWETRVPVQSSPKKSRSRQASKTGKNTNSPTTKTPVSVKSFSPNGKVSLKARKLSYEAAEKTITPKGATKAEVASTIKV